MTLSPLGLLNYAADGSEPLPASLVTVTSPLAHHGKTKAAQAPRGRGIGSLFCLRF